MASKVATRRRTVPEPDVGRTGRSSGRCTDSIARTSRSSGTRVPRNSTALATTIATVPTPRTTASETSRSEEMVAGDTARTTMPSTNTSPLVRQTRQ